MIAWMLWSIGFAALIFAGALAAERVAGVFGVARRHVWMVAIVAAAVVPPILATQSRSESPPELVLVEVFPNGPIPVGGSPRTFARSPVVHATQPASRTASRSNGDANRAAIALWAFASLMVGIVFARTMLRLRRESATWPEITVGEYRALLAPNAGPAVVGFTRPRIVLPEWALTIEADLRELMLCHEAEHIRARDPRTVMIAGALLVLFPWNAVMWLIVRQLRRAMELDCDARVIRAAGNAGTYGRVLLTVGERFTAPLPLGASLAAPRPLLEQRIHAMTAPRSRRPLRVALPFIALALLVTTAAVGVPRPASLGPIELASRPVTRNPAQNTVRSRLSAPARAESSVTARAVNLQSGAQVARSDEALPPQVVPVPVKADSAAFDRWTVLATARANFPEVMRGDVKATSLILIFDAQGQLVRGFPAVGSVMIAVGGDTLSATQRRALQRDAAVSGSSGSSGSRGAGRGGRGGGSTGAVPSSGRTTYIVGFGMTTSRDSLGNARPAPTNQSEGLVTIPISGDVSGIAGIPASAITNVDQFSLNERDGFAARFDLLAVHLTAAGVDTIRRVSRGRPQEAMYEFTVLKDTGQSARKPTITYEFAVRKDTGQVAEKKKATVKSLVILPVPIPENTKPFTMRACYEVATDGKAKLLEWTKSKDAAYNLKIAESLKKYEFNPATLNGVAVLDTACVRAVGG